MLVLLNIEDHERPDSNDPNEQAKKAFAIVNSQYNEDADVDDAYVYDPCDSENCAEELDFVDGRTDPDRIREIATGWNKEIEDEFARCLENIQKDVPKRDDGSANWLNAERHNIYMLKKAARALDNDFESFADHGLLVNRNRYFTVVLSDDQLKAIMDHPERYVCLDVTTK